ncbi:MAG TPA: DUF4290 domain-containing protein [Chitinophagales bacterium]|nr:DUF4290 domain-containing protein [Chitinophagales bacterium]
MNYNTEREAIIMREYGRNLQRCIDYAKTIPNKEQRQKAAEDIISYMEILNPQLKQSQDYERKMWTQLFIMSNFELDVDSPYPVPHSKEEAELKPEPLPYPRSNIKMKHYGKNVQALIKRAVALDDTDKEEELIQLIANYMKTSYKNWSNEEVNNDLIREDIRNLSKGELEISDDMDIEITAPTTTKRASNRRRGQSSNRRGSSRNNRNNNRSNRRYR